MDFQTLHTLAQIIGPYVGDIQNVFSGPKSFYLSRKVNTNHPLVERLQMRLNELGYLVAVDGIYGPATQAAVAEHQAKSELGIDGIAGTETLASIFVNQRA